MSAAAAAPRGDNFPLHPSASDVDVVMAALHGKQAEWASLPLTEKADILKARMLVGRARLEST